VTEVEFFLFQILFCLISSRHVKIKKIKRKIKKKIENI